MNYQTVYDYSETILDPITIFPIIFAVIGPFFLIYGIQSLKNKSQKQSGAPFIIIWGVGASVLGSFTSIFLIANHFYLNHAYSSGNFKILEGKVHVIHEQPRGGHAAGDIIEIDGQQIEFSYFTAGGGYKQTIAHGGFLREGTQARLYVKNDDILRVDILTKEE